MNNKLKIWCTYHELNQLIDYNLYDTDLIKLYYSNKVDNEKENINQLNIYLSELVTYYYVWKNQIKSDYIGFCHYRRHFRYLHFDDIQKNVIQAYFGWEIDPDDYHSIISRDNFYGYTANSKKIYNEYIYYLKDKYNIDVNTLLANKKQFNQKMFITANISYVMSWSIFNEICEFIFGFYDYIANKLNVNWKTEDGIIQVSNYFYDMNKPYSIQRFISIASEYLISAFITLKYDVNPYNDEKNNYVIIYNTKDKNTFLNVLKKNLKTGIVAIINNENINYNENEKTYYFSFLKDSKLLNDINLDECTVFRLKNNEYIDCKDFYDVWHNKKYNIKTI